MVILKSWMTGLVNNRRHMRSTSALAFALSFVLSAMVQTRVVCTLVTPSKPKSCSALMVFWPSGSEMPGLRWTVTWALTKAIPVPTDPGRRYRLGFAPVRNPRKSQVQGHARLQRGPQGRPARSRVPVDAADGRQGHAAILAALPGRPARHHRDLRHPSR